MFFYYVMVKSQRFPMPHVICQTDDMDEAEEAYKEAMEDDENAGCHIILTGRKVSNYRLPR